jgi:FkbM family methyltransferase
MQKQVLLAVATATRRLPNFRGKVRGLAELHKFLGLQKKHFTVATTLHRPVPFQMQLDLFCQHEKVAFFMDGYEPDTAEFLGRLWQPGEAFLDVGANIGLIAIPFALLCDQARVYCIEAVTANKESLVNNVTLNGLDDRIIVIGSAVGDREKNVDIQVENDLKAGEGTGTANILSEHTDYVCERIPLHVTTIDRLIAQGKLPDNVGLIKIDTDGYDLFTLLGAPMLIEKSRPIVYGEFMAHCLNWHGQTIDDVEMYLAPFGYQLYVRGTGWKFTRRVKDTPFVQDALCVPAETVEHLRWCIS